MNMMHKENDKKKHDAQRKLSIDWRTATGWLYISHTANLAQDWLTLQAILTIITMVMTSVASLMICIQKSDIAR